MNKKIFKTYIIVNLISLLIIIFWIFSPIMYYEVNYPDTPVWDDSFIVLGSGVITPIFASVFVIISLLTTYKYKINVAVISGIIGALLTTVSILLVITIPLRVMEEYWFTEFDGVFVGPTFSVSFFTLFIPIIILWVSNFKIFKYIKIRQCSRCENLFTKEELVKCDECGKEACPNCLEPKLNICNKCHRKHTIKMDVIEKSKPSQTQSQQVVIQQAPQIPVSQTPNGMKHCIHCGNMIKLAAQFCDKCGKTQ